MLQPKESAVVSVRFKSRKLEVKGRINNFILASNKVKAFEIPQEQFKNLLIL